LVERTGFEAAFGNNGFVLAAVQTPAIGGGFKKRAWRNW